MKKLAAVISTIACLTFSNLASADVNKVTVGRGTPFGHLPFIVMQYYKLFEKHADQLGIKNLQIDWDTHSTTAVANDALLAGRLDILSTGLIPAIVLWSKTKGTPQEIKSIAAEAAIPAVLSTRNPNIKSIRDLTDKDRIAVVGVKVSTNAIMLEMAAAKEFGDQNWEKLDPLTETRSAQDSVAALLSPASEIDLDFSVPPFSTEEAEHPGIHVVLNSAEILGGTPGTFSVAVTRTAFYNQNPTLMKAFFDALKDADNIIATDKPATIKAYDEMGDKFPGDIMTKALSDPTVQFTVTPTGAMFMSQWLQKVKMVDTVPSSWKELFLPTVEGLNGN